MDAGHFYSRRYTAILFDEKNVHAQCVKCNYSGGEQYLYSLRIQALYGQKELDRLTKAKTETKKFTPKELQNLITSYKSRVKEIITVHGSPWKI